MKQNKLSTQPTKLLKMQKHQPLSIKLYQHLNRNSTETHYSLPNPNSQEKTSALPPTTSKHSSVEMTPLSSPIQFILSATTRISRVLLKARNLTRKNSALNPRGRSRPFPPCAPNMCTPVWTVWTPSSQVYQSNPTLARSTSRSTAPLDPFRTLPSLC